MRANQDRPEIGQLVEEYYALLYRFAVRLSGSAADADDLTQQTYLTAQTKLHQLKDISRAKAWLFTILKNLYLKDRRSAATKRVQTLESIPELGGLPKAEDFAVDQDALQQALNEIPDEFRLPLVLFYFQEFSYREIAEQLDVPIGTVMSRLARAKSHLRNKLVKSQPHLDTNKPDLTTVSLKP